MAARRGSAFDVDQDDSTIMRATLIEYALEGLLARMRKDQMGKDDIKEVVVPVWLLAMELRRDLQELASTETPPGRESVAPRKET